MRGIKPSGRDTCDWWHPWGFPPQHFCSLSSEFPASSSAGLLSNGKSGAMRATGPQVSSSALPQSVRVIASSGQPLTASLAALTAS